MPFLKEINAKAAAVKIGISERAVYRLCEDGTLKHRRPLPRVIWINEDSVDAFIEATKDPEYWTARK
jgi:predicted DNA-binding transcriptional regulator AlpA